MFNYTVDSLENILSKRNLHLNFQIQLHNAFYFDKEQDESDLPFINIDTIKQSKIRISCSNDFCSKPSGTLKEISTSFINKSLKSLSCFLFFELSEIIDTHEYILNSQSFFNRYSKEDRIKKIEFINKKLELLWDLQDETELIASFVMNTPQIKGLLQQEYKIPHSFNVNDELYQINFKSPNSLFELSEHDFFSLSKVYIANEKITFDNAENRLKSILFFDTEKTQIHKDYLSPKIFKYNEKKDVFILEDCENHNTKHSICFLNENDALLHLKKLNQSLNSRLSNQNTSF